MSLKKKRKIAVRIHVTAENKVADLNAINTISRYQAGNQISVNNV